MKALRIALLGFILGLAGASGVSAAAYDDLINAVNLGDTGKVVSFIDRGLDVNSVDPRGETLLIIAARNGYTDLVKALLARRAKVEAVNAVGETALAVAAFNGHVAVVEQLLAAGANPVNTQAGRRCTTRRCRGTRQC